MYDRQRANNKLLECVGFIVFAVVNSDMIKLQSATDSIHPWLPDPLIGCFSFSPLHSLFVSHLFLYFFLFSDFVLVFHLHILSLSIFSSFRMVHTYLIF